MVIEKVPVWEKANLSLEEAAAYFGIGINKLRDMTNDENWPFVLWNGNKRLIKRKQLEWFLETAYSICAAKCFVKKVWKSRSYHVTMNIYFCVHRFTGKCTF